MANLTHFDDAGAAAMVDVGAKTVTRREATAEAVVAAAASTIAAIRDGSISKKGDVLSVARLAGIMGAKRTADLIPLCHMLPLDSVSVAFEFRSATELCVQATAGVTAKTGVEMEALTAASVAALTVYDMCKGVDRGIVVREIRLLRKTGGRSGEWTA